MKKNNINKLAFLSIIILGFLCRLYITFHAPIWHDEAFSIWAAPSPTEINKPIQSQYNSIIEKIVNDKTISQQISQTLNVTEAKKYPWQMQKEQANYQPISYSIINQGNETIEPHIVVNDRDWSTSKGILIDALQNTTATDAASIAEALWTFVKENRYHHQSPLPPNDKKIYHEIANAPQLFNSWGYATCGDTAHVLAQMGSMMGIKSRSIHIEDPQGKNSHAITEFFYNNGWHMYDADRKVVYKNRDGSIASYNDIKTNPSLLEQTKKQIDGNDGINLTKMQNDTFSINASIVMELDEFFTPNTPSEIQYSLNPREMIRYYYNWPSTAYWNDINRKPKVFSNGLLFTPIDRLAMLTHYLSGKAIDIKLPYPIVGLYLYNTNCQNLSFTIQVENYSHNNKPNNCKEGLADLSQYIPTGTGSLPTHNINIIPFLSLEPTIIITKFQFSPKSFPKFNYQNTIDNLTKVKKERTNIRLDYAYYPY